MHGLAVFLFGRPLTILLDTVSIKTEISGEMCSGTEGCMVINLIVIGLIVHDPANNTAYNPGEASATGGALATW